MLPTFYALNVLILANFPCNGLNVMKLRKAQNIIIVEIKFIIIIQDRIFEYCKIPKCKNI